MYGMASAANAIRRTDASSDGRRCRQGRAAVNLLAATSAALVVCLTWTAGAWAAAPANDAFDAATPIAVLPFSDTLDMTDASVESGEPAFCFGNVQSAWYSITPAESGTLAVDTIGSTVSSQVTLYRAHSSGFGGLSFVGCNNFGDQGTFEVEAGVKYYIQASTIFGSGGTVHVAVKTQLPPANDDFANATAIGSVPFFEATDQRGATTEDDEPTTCRGISSPSTTWYAFTPAQSDSYVAGRTGFGGAVAVYSGSSLSNLTQISCDSQQTVFRADAGTTYYLQNAGGGFLDGFAQFSLSVAPQAQAQFFYFPSDPSIFDTVSFYDASHDLAGIASRSWNLGDGFTSTSCCPAHRYAADGTYTAKLDIVTTDGRTASHSQPVPVKTHDVAITRMTVPAKGQVGRTKPIAVAVNNSRYAETVQVAILRSVPGQGFEEVGQVTQRLPARAARRSTTFSISYTFDEQDASLGKVTFQAVATILTARDAHPADNTVIAPSTKVPR